MTCREPVYEPAAELRAEDHEKSRRSSTQRPLCQRRDVATVLEEHGQHEADPELTHREIHDAGEQAVPVRLESQVREFEERGAGAATLRPAPTNAKVTSDRDGDPRRRTGSPTHFARVTGHIDVPGDAEVLDRCEPAVDAALAQREHEREHADHPISAAPGDVDLQRFRLAALAAVLHEDERAQVVASGAITTLMRNAHRHE